LVKNKNKAFEEKIKGEKSSRIFVLKGQKQRKTYPSI